MSLLELLKLNGLSDFKKDVDIEAVACIHNLSTGSVQYSFKGTVANIALTAGTESSSQRCADAYAIATGITVVSRRTERMMFCPAVTVTLPISGLADQLRICSGILRVVLD